LTQDIRRRRDGSIDYDFYRARATAMRRFAMGDDGVWRLFAIAPVTVAVLSLGVVVAATPLRIAGEQVRTALSYVLPMQ
jgi:hypothetical protein